MHLKRIFMVLFGSDVLANALLTKSNSAITQITATGRELKTNEFEAQYR
ncbi:TPA: hypothetical protein ACHVIH_001931 [Streptococcus suis]|nr:hypothetical protein [Streptococcus suis]NQO62963.1 hypothetical protein [Streptococcus suis]NQP11124.1 hypothetical protein [Streptococcus suis]HEL2165545.1 hypothetical protein [Streptococcus suis]